MRPSCMGHKCAFHCTFIYCTKQNSNTDAEVFPLCSWYRALARSASSSSKGRPGNWRQDRHLPQVHPRSFQHGQWPQQDREPEIQQWEHEPVISNIMAITNGCCSILSACILGLFPQMYPRRQKTKPKVCARRGTNHMYLKYMGRNVAWKCCFYKTLSNTLPLRVVNGHCSIKTCI